MLSANNSLSNTTVMSTSQLDRPTKVYPQSPESMRPSAKILPAPDRSISFPSTPPAMRPSPQLRKKQKPNFPAKKLFGIVNNAGIGLNTGQTGDMLNTNLYGPKRVCESFIPLMDETQKNGGRIINIGSGSGPMHVSSSSQQDKQKLCSPDTTTWDYIEEHAKAGLNNYNTDVYGLSKALVACYTGVLAREHPNLLISCCTPGFIDTQMTAGWGASKSPEQGTAAILHCLFDELEDGSGLYYGSDGVRSPYHFMRNPGQPAYDGVNPFI